MKYYHTIETMNKGKPNEYQVDFGYDIRKLPIESPLWAVAYDINDDTEYRRLSCAPIRGEITEKGYFYPYKKETLNRRKTGRVGIQSRMYADTYEEAVELYNELVQKRIDNLCRLIKDAEKDFLEVNTNDRS